jgi:hypothetical protein
MTNFARFTVDDDPSSNRGVDVLNSGTSVFKLETPTSEAWKATFSVYDATDVNSPLASKDAPALTLDNGAGSTGKSVSASPVSGEVEADWPASGAHSWIVRCTVNNGVNPDGSANADYVFERMVSIRSAAGRRKIVATEGTQYSPRGWADAQNEDVDAPAESFPDHNDIDGRDDAECHPGESVTLDDAAFSGNLVGVTDVQTMAGVVDGLAVGGTVDAADVTIDDTDLTGPLAGVTDAQEMAAVVDGMREGWVGVTGFTAAPASASTITMTTDHTSWVRKGDAIKLFVSVPVISKNNVIVS